MAEDLQLELAQSRSWLEPERLDERLPAAPVGRERVGLPAAAVEGEHQLAEQPLTRGMVRDERLELRHERRPRAALELARDPLLDRKYAELVELPRVRAERRNIAQGITAPESERLHKLFLLAEAAKANRVDGDAGVERVGGVRELDRIRAEEPAQARDVGLHDLRCAARVRLLPEHILDRRDLDRGAGMQREQCQKRPLLRRAELDRLVVHRASSGPSKRISIGIPHCRPGVDRPSTAACNTSGMSRSPARGLCAATLTLAAAVAHIGGASAGPASTVVLKATLTGPYLHTTAKGTGRPRSRSTPGSELEVHLNGIDPPNISGIHVAPPPPAGYHKTSVFPFTARTSSKPGCETLDRWGGPQGPKWAAKIVANPGAFYVIIGTGRYPNGAIGGVLHAA